MWSPNRLRSAGLTIHFTANLNEFTISFRKQYVWTYVPWNYCWRRKTPTSEWRKLICSRKNGTKPYDRRIHMNQLIIPPKNQRFFIFIFYFFSFFRDFSSAIHSETHRMVPSQGNVLVSIAWMSPIMRTRCLGTCKICWGSFGYPPWN